MPSALSAKTGKGLTGSTPFLKGQHAKWTAEPVYAVALGAVPLTGTTMRKRAPITTGCSSGSDKYSGNAVRVGDIPTTGRSAAASKANGRSRWEAGHHHGMIQRSS